MRSVLAEVIRGMPERSSALFCQRMTDEAPAVLRHEVDGFGVIFSAASVMSPSFSLASSSRTMMNLPCLKSSTASSTLHIGIPFRVAHNLLKAVVKTRPRRWGSCSGGTDHLRLSFS